MTWRWTLGFVLLAFSAGCGSNDTSGAGGNAGAGGTGGSAGIGGAPGGGSAGVGGASGGTGGASGGTGGASGTSGCDVTAPTELVTGPYNALAVSVGDADVFWMVADTSKPAAELHRVAKTGGADETLAPGGAPFALGSDLYWTDGKDILRTSFPAKTTSVLVSGHAASEIAVDGSHLFWTEYDQTSSSGSLLLSDLDGQNVKTLYSGSGSVSRPRPDGTAVFVDDSEAVYSVPTSGAAATLVVPTQDSLMGIGVTPQKLYFAKTDLGVPGIFSLPKTGGTIEKLSDLAVQSMSLDAKAAYVIDADWNVQRVPLDGSPPTLIDAVGKGNPFAITNDSGCVYWVEQQSGKVMKAPKY